MSEVVLKKVDASDLGALAQWLQANAEGYASRLRARLEAQKEAASAKK